MTTPSDIISHLSSIPNAKITRILPCYVTIGRRTYPAARYTEVRMTPQGTPAWARGEREYSLEMIYCVGFLPSAKVRGNVAFVIDGEPNEWYVASYYGAVTDRQQETKEPNEYHPFGNMFLMSPWNLEGAIDQYERVPYKRMKAHVGL